MSVSESRADLVVKDLTVEFTKGDYTVRPLDNMSFTVQAGSLALLLGPSGCGKTTLLSCLGGILKPTAGTIAHGATQVTTLSGQALTQYRQRGVGVVFQAFNLVASLTAVENVVVPMRSAGVSARRGARPCRRIAERRRARRPLVAPPQQALAVDNNSVWPSPAHSPSTRC